MPEVDLEATGAREVSPAALRDALSGAGFVVAGRGASYTRWQWAEGDGRHRPSLTAPDDDRFADTEDLIGDVLAALEDAARRGEQARRALALLAGDVPVESAPAAEVVGSATVEKLPDGTLVVRHADPTIAIARELLDEMDKDGLRQPGGRIWLDSAGEYEYTFHRNEASLKGFRHDVLIYQRVHRGKCYETSPVECGGCECWCHAEAGGAASVASADTTKGD